MLCKWCSNGRRNSKDGVYCQLYGIMIHREHRGCRYFSEKDESDEKNSTDNQGETQEQEK